MEILAAIIGGAAGISWLVALVSWVVSLGHLAEGVTVGQMLFNGARAFDPASYATSGRPHQRRFLIAAALFFLLLVVAVALGAAAGCVSEPSA